MEKDEEGKSPRQHRVVESSSGMTIEEMESKVTELRETLGRCHEQTISTIIHLHQALCRDHKFDAARELVDETLVEAVSELSSDHKDTLWLLTTLTIFLWSREDFPNLVILFNEAKQKFSKESAYYTNITTVVQKLFDSKGVPNIDATFSKPKSDEVSTVFLKKMIASKKYSLIMFFDEQHKMWTEGKLLKDHGNGTADIANKWDRQYPGTSINNIRIMSVYNSEQRLYNVPLSTQISCHFFCSRPYDDKPDAKRCDDISRQCIACARLDEIVEAAVAPRCPRKHGMYRLDFGSIPFAFNREVACFRCKSDVSRQSSYYHCVTCDYDQFMCAECQAKDACLNEELSSVSASEICAPTMALNISGKKDPCCSLQ